MQTAAFTDPTFTDPTFTDNVDIHTRLKRSVHRHKAVSVSGLQERLFTLLFSGLVYPQIWEDPEIDLEAMALTPSSHIVTIASGGCNMMSYLAANPARITAVDLNPAHVALNRLKLAAAAHLPDYEHFRRFFAQADSADNVAAYWTHLSPHLDARSRGYWEGRTAFGRKRISLFQKNFYRFGLLGRFIGATHLAAGVFGVDFRVLLRARTLEDQRAFFEDEIAPVFRSKFVRWVMDQPPALFGLGIPPSQFKALAAGRPMHEVLEERVRHLICDFPLQTNYFAWQAFARSYEPTADAAVPPYLQPQHFAALRRNHSRVDVHNRAITDLLRREPAKSVDRFVLLDAQDWMTDTQLNALWAEILRTARTDARVIFRTADAPSVLPGRLESDVLRRWTYHEADSRDWTQRDRSAIYGGFHLYSLDQ